MHTIKPINEDQTINSSLSEPGSRRQVEVVYYTDPLCCWSWALEPQWRKLQFEFDGALNIRYCMAGLIPDWKSFNDPVNNVSRPVQMGPVWMQASYMSGMPVNPNIWISDPPASSYFACMAVKAAALQSAQAGSVYLRALREAIMLNSINISKAGALLKIAETVAHKQPDVLNFTIFKKDLAEDHAKKAFERDIAEARMRNISRCPTLLFRYQGESGMAISGYHSYAALLKVLQHAAPSVNKVQKTDSREAYINYWKTLTDRELEEIYNLKDANAE